MSQPCVRAPPHAGLGPRLYMSDRSHHSGWLFPLPHCFRPTPPSNPASMTITQAIRPTSRLPRALQGAGRRDHGLALPVAASQPAGLRSDAVREVFSGMVERFQPRSAAAFDNPPSSRAHRAISPRAPAGFFFAPLPSADMDLPGRRQPVPRFCLPSRVVTLGSRPALAPSLCGRPAASSTAGIAGWASSPVCPGRAQRDRTQAGGIPRPVIPPHPLAARTDRPPAGGPTARGNRAFFPEANTCAATRRILPRAPAARKNFAARAGQSLCARQRTSSLPTAN